MFRRRTPPRITAPRPPASEAEPPVVLKTPPMKPFRRTRPAPGAAAYRSPPPRNSEPCLPRTAHALAQRGAEPGGHAVASQSADEAARRVLSVGRGIRLTGEIKACARLNIEGSVEAELVETQHLEVAEGGYFRGSAQVESCTIAGRFEGELTVTGLLAVRASGRISGSLRYGELEVARGGRITGRTDLAGAAESWSTVSGPTEAAAPSKSSGAVQLEAVRAGPALGLRSA